MLLSNQRRLKSARPGRAKTFQVVLSSPSSAKVTNFNPLSSSYYESIDFKVCEGVYVTHDTNPDKFSFDHASGDGSMRCSSIQVVCLFFFFF